MKAPRSRDTAVATANPNTIGANDNAAEVHVNTTPPTVWREGLFYEPHGITYDATGNLLVTEFNQYGRISRVERK